MQITSVPFSRVLSPIRRHCSFGLFAFSLLFLSCATAPQNQTLTPAQKKQLNLHAFVQKLEQNPDSIWALGISQKTQAALHAFREGQRVGPRKLIYGASVKKLNLANQSFSQLDSAITRLDCKKRQDVLKNPTTQQPSLDSSGHTIPMVVYLCPDGGVFRIKPIGDPTSRFRTQPHASKALRFPYDSQFENFDDEILKVDNQGRPIPKWGKDLNVFSKNPAEQKDLVEGWAEDAHTDLPSP